MENKKYVFLQHEKAKVLFAETDLWLKSGYYIQEQHPEQRQHFRFIEESPDLKDYYSTFYNINLEYGQDDSNNKYYYIDFFRDKKDDFERGKVSLFKQEYLSVEFVIVGVLLAYIDIADHVGSIKELQTMLHHDYEEYKEGIYRLFANVQNKKKLLASDSEIVNKKIESALRKFGEIGWLYFTPQTDKFEIMPSFHRLINDLYYDEIKNFDKIFKLEKTYEQEV